MSTSFTAIQPVQIYRGQTFRLPVKMAQGYISPVGSVPPSVCPVTLDWLVYYTALNGAQTSLCVEVNLQAQSVQAQILDRVAAVKIDNTGNGNPVYVWFEDTNDVVTCPPNTVVIQRVYTNLVKAKILTQGLTAGRIGQTRVFFLNFVEAPTVDPEISQAVAKWLASPTITRGTTIYNETYGVPALGDQTVQPVIDLASNGGNNQVLNILPVVPNQFYYFTDLWVSVLDAEQAGAGANSLFTFVLESTGVAGVLYTFRFIAGKSPAAAYYTPLFQMSGGNIKVDAGQQWRIRNASPLVSGNFTYGFFNVYLNYTLNPN